MTYEEARRIAYQDYDKSKKKNRVYEIFNPKSITNKCLNNFSKIIKDHAPDVDKELAKLGFDHVLRYEYPDYVTPNLVTIYSNDKDDQIIWMHDGITVVEFNGVKKSFEATDVIGETDRKAIEWIKSKC